MRKQEDICVQRSLLCSNVTSVFKCHFCVQMSLLWQSPSVMMSLTLNATLIYPVLCSIQNVGGTETHHEQEVATRKQFALFQKHWWFSGRILACHAGGPGSIPGQCNFSVHKLFSYFIACAHYGHTYNVQLTTYLASCVVQM